MLSLFVVFQLSCYIRKSHHGNTVTEQERLVAIDEEWTDILARHKALLSLLNPKYDSSNTVALSWLSLTTDLFS